MSSWPRTDVDTGGGAGSLTGVDIGGSAGSHTDVDTCTSGSTCRAMATH